MIRGLLALALLLLASTADAQGAVAARQMGVRWEGGVPHVYFSARDLVDAAARRKLESGLPQRLALRIYAYAEGARQPITIAPIGCRVVYDLWEERYRVELETAAGTRTRALTTTDQVLRECLVVRSAPVGTALQYAARRGRRVYFAVLAELNPVSPETVQRIRRWLARSATGLEGEAFFGSFVGVFVNRNVGDAERTVRFRSQDVPVP